MLNRFTGNAETLVSVAALVMANGGTRHLADRLRLCQLDPGYWGAPGQIATRYRVRRV